MTLQGVISLLDDDHFGMVKGIARELQDRFGVEEAKPNLWPHFSYVVAESFDERVVEALQKLREDLTIFRIQTAGLGVFLSGPSPVIFANIVRNETLSRAHKRVWQAVVPFAKGAQAYYEPDNWVPHITLGDKYLRPGTLPDIIRWLQDQDFVWDIEVNNLTFIGADGFDNDRIVRIPLNGTQMNAD